MGAVHRSILVAASRKESPGHGGRSERNCHWLDALSRRSPTFHDLVVTLVFLPSYVNDDSYGQAVLTASPPRHSAAMLCCEELTLEIAVQMVWFAIVRWF